MPVDTPIDVNLKPYPDHQWVGTQTAALILGKKPRTLEDWRTDGRGPPYSRPDGSQCRYLVRDLREWLAAGRRRAAA